MGSLGLGVGVLGRPRATRALSVVEPGMESGTFGFKIRVWGFGFKV